MLAFLRTIRFAFQSFWRNLWLSIVTVFILTLTMLSLSLVATVNILTQQALQVLEDKVNIDVYLVAGLDEDIILGYQAQVSGYVEVQEVVYISQGEARQAFLLEHASDPTIQASIESLTDNPFPASLVIKAKQLDDYDDIISKIEGSEMNQHIQSKDFSDNRQIVNSINKIVKRISQFGIGISAVFILISVIMIFNTIRIAIYAHRDELNIMKLVGATNWFIRGPFLIESILYAVVAAILTTVACGALSVFVYPYIADFFYLPAAGSNLLVTYIPLTLLAEIVVATALSLGSTALAMRRYLKT